MTRGRKKGSIKPESLNARLTARCTDEERVKIQQAATRAKKTESEFIREAAVERAGGGQLCKK